MYQIYMTEEFRKLKNKLDGSEQQWISKIMDQLQVNPSGKILCFSWFREKKYLNKRLYYLVDEKRRNILFIAYESKKDQRSVIRNVVQKREEFLEKLRKF
ncbi:hypothetical protein EXS74_03700 [Candidatus Woesearchaeota archaeon]|nr:hypothetical protein [Candidatus Woesearchaeota archaeon]